MNAQQIFDTVASHLLTQGKRSKDGEGCAYRGHGGAKCAVGCLITDGEYRKSMERMRVYALLDSGLLPNRLRPYAHLLAELQVVHDCVLPGCWPSALAKAARDYGLIFTEAAK